MMRNFARREPGAFQVRIDDVIPVFFGVLEERLRHDDAGVVDEDRQWPESILYRPYGCNDAVAVGDVAGERQARAAAALDLARELLQTIGAPRRRRDLRAGRREHLGEMPADAARRAGDQQNLAGNVEARHDDSGVAHDAISFACSRSAYFCTLPVEVFGNGPKTTCPGAL